MGPSDKRLPWPLTEGAYKLEALPPSRNKALGQFRPSRNRRAKASNDTSPWEMANMTLPSARTPTPVRALSEVLPRSKRGCTRPFITSIGPDCVARSVWGRCLRNACVSTTAAVPAGHVENPIRLHLGNAIAGTGIYVHELSPLFHIQAHRLEGRIEHAGVGAE